MERWAEVRRLHFVRGLSIREIHRHTVADVQEQFVRDQEIDPALYYPADVARDLVRVFPRGFKIEIPKMIKQKVGGKIREKLGRS